MVALEDSQLLMLDAAAYAAIMADGFDGQLNAKVALLKNCPALAACLSSRSDVRGLAYSAVRQSLGWGEQLYGAGAAGADSPAGAVAGAADALFVIHEGSCRVSLLQELQIAAG